MMTDWPNYILSKFLLNEARNSDTIIGLANGVRLQAHHMFIENGYIHITNKDGISFIINSASICTMQSESGADMREQEQ